jgi:formamidopyrimidine-DNA glycosylase
MPELPEVQTIADGIEPYLLNKKIIKCNVYADKLRWQLQKNLSKNN